MTKNDKIRICEEINKLKEWQPIASPSLNKLLSFIDSFQCEDENTTTEDDDSFINKLIDLYYANYIAMSAFS